MVAVYLSIFCYSDIVTRNERKVTRNVLKEASEGWWYARSHVTGLCGYIPVPYIARLKSIEAEPWFFGDITRGDCERRLLAAANDHGSFLIRKAESRKNEYSLSVRDMTKVKHYRIRPKDHGGFFISRKDPFPSLHDLVDYYSKGAHGLCTRLNKPCVKVDTPETQGLSHDTWDVWEIHKDQVELLRKLGSGQFGHVYEGRWNKTVPVAVKTLKPGEAVTVIVIVIVIVIVSANTGDFARGKTGQEQHKVKKKGPLSYQSPCRSEGVSH
ncbi:Tyrosine-protein kinase Src42A [Portunus trituberculatus]|uniref:Tyrosine-protein kinase n=1 Tax=Portunus trituberculatus TaxID=210409 RepID=A0A5B7FPB2_PORTR|nr:Tyrosine-protein kinase Src42A [Portunus trituberculatus]